MSLAEASARAAVHGFTAVLPLSASGHGVALGLWLGDATYPDAVSAAAQLGCAIALSLALRQRLARAMSDGIRGFARPAVLVRSDGGRDATFLVIAAVCAIATTIGLSGAAGSLNYTPPVAGLGLLLTGALLLSTWRAPLPHQTCPGMGGALLAGLAFGLAQVPGMSQVGFAYVVLRWLGVSGWRAAQLAMLIAIPTFALQAVRALLVSTEPGIAGGTIVAATLIALITASAAAATWRAICERNLTAWLGLWLLPLALAMVSYDHAIPRRSQLPPLNQLNSP